MVLLALTCALSCNRVEVARDAAHPRNVLLVTIDTLRADHVGAYGAPDVATPSLDALAAEGVRFASAFSSAPVTLPSHATIFTALQPPHHGARYNGIFRLDEAALTLAERLRDAGFATGAVVGAFVVARQFGLAQGFDHYDDADMWGRRAGPGGYLERSAGEVTDRARAWLARSESPFFLWVHYFDPHKEYQPPPPHADRFRDRPYDGEIAYVDAELARLVAALRERGELERTLLVATSDHGESLGEHGENTHSYSLYDATLHVPLLVRGPGVPAGRVVPELVRSVDVAPTVLALLALPPFEGADGLDLSPLWRGNGAAAPGIAYAETFAPLFDHGWSPLFAARSKEFLYVRAPRPELYAVGPDSRELHNLFEVHPKFARATADAFEYAVAPLAAIAPGEASPIDARTAEKLRALGYAVADGPVAASGTDPKDGLPALRLYHEALTAFDAERLDSAEARVRQVLAKLPESPNAHSLLARIQLVRGGYAEALSHLEVSISRVPRSALYHSLAGDAHAGLGDLDAALRSYERANQLEPHMAPAHVGLMWRRLRGGSLEEAEKHAERAAKLMPKSADLLARIATVWEQLGEPERALAAALRAVEAEEGSARAHMEAAIQLARAGWSPEAERHLERAGVLARDLRLAQRMARAFAQGGDAGRSEAILRGLVAEHPAQLALRQGLAFLLRGEGREAEAAEIERATP